MPEVTRLRACAAVKLKVVKIQIKWYIDTFFHHKFDKTVAADSLFCKQDLLLELDLDMFSKDKIDFRL